MAVKDISSASNAEYMMLSQTPGRYSPDNYYDKELQGTIDRNWDYRPNRATVEYESVWGEGNWQPVEVAVQTVKTDSGTSISDDYRRLVFRDIRETRFLIGSKFRFSPEYDISEDEEKKDIWLVMNRNTVSLTSSVVAVRCNGTLGSLHKDSHGIATAHYEPTIFGLDMRYVNNEYSQTAVSNQSTLTIYVQWNKYTKEYFINQRFVVGEDQIFRIKGIDSFYAQGTFDPKTVGIAKIYLEKQVSSALDNFETRIAYQQTQEPEQTQTGATGDYSIQFDLPETMPSALYGTPVPFEAHLYNGSAQQSQAVTPSISLANLPSGVDQAIYVTMSVTGSNTFTIQRNRAYQLGDLTLNVSVPAADSPTGSEISSEIKFVMRLPG